MTDEQLEVLRMRLAVLGRPYTPADVAQEMRAIGLVVSDALLLRCLDLLRRTSVGCGPLEELLGLPGVTDVLVNGPDQVYLDQGCGLRITDVRFGSDEQVRRLAVRLAAAAGRRLDDASPCVDARLPSGIRLHAVLSALADPGTCISLRIPARRRFTICDWLDAGSITEECAELLRAIIDSRTAFLVSGGTGSGKTTLLAAMLSLVPAAHRLVICEDSRELDPDHPHCIRLEARQPNAEGTGAVTLTQLVRQALRMRPDRLIVGEVRGAELCDLLSALNTGHEGGCGTVHANSVADVPARLEALAALGGLAREATQAQVAAALKIVIHVARAEDGNRRVSGIGIVDRSRGDVRVLPAVSFEGKNTVTGEGHAELKRILQ